MARPRRNGAPCLALSLHLSPAPTPDAVLKLCLQLLVLLVLLLRSLRLLAWLRRPRRATPSSRGRIDGAGRSLAGDFRRDLRRRGLLVSLPQERVD